MSSTQSFVVAVLLGLVLAWSFQYYVAWLLLRPNQRTRDVVVEDVWSSTTFEDTDDRLQFANECGFSNLSLASCRQRCSDFAQDGVRPSFRPTNNVDHEIMSCHLCPYPTEADALFNAVESLSQNRRWGAVLDAGSGPGSLQWLIDLSQRQDSLDSLVAVTASQWMLDEMASVARDAFVKKDVPVNASLDPEVDDFEFDQVALYDKNSSSNRTLLLGDWADKTAFLEDQFDTIIADYLIGAVDGFSPYEQETVLANVAARLRNTTSRLYLIGTEPYPDTAFSMGTHLILETARLRDSCILLMHHRVYREFPRLWIERALVSAGLQVITSRSFPIVYGPNKLFRQLDVCRQKILKKGLNTGIHKALLNRVEHLSYLIAHNEEIASGSCFGHDYIVEASLKTV